MTTAEQTADGGQGFGGRRFVVVLYVALVGVATVMGVLFTVAVESPEPPALFFLFELPPTPVGFGLYGGVTIAVVLGVPLLFVVAVSAFVDDVDAVGRAEVATDADDARDTDERDGEEPASVESQFESPKD